MFVNPAAKHRKNEAKRDALAKSPRTTNTRILTVSLQTLFEPLHDPTAIIPPVVK